MPFQFLEFEKPIAKMEQEIERLEASQAETGRDYSDEIRGIREQLGKAVIGQPAVIEARGLSKWYGAVVGLVDVHGRLRGPVVGRPVAVARGLDRGPGQV